MKLKLKTTKYYHPGPCTIFWTQDDWNKSATYRTEPKRLKCAGYMWRTLGERDSKGNLLYLRAEKLADD